MAQHLRSLLFLLLIPLSACSRQVQIQPDPTYLELAPGGTFEAVTNARQLQPFIALFRNLDAANIEANFEPVYAETLYFNDTFHTFTRREQIRAYFTRMASTATTEVTPLDYSQKGQDVWLRWSMRTRFSVLWRDLDITTLGVTHLRFNEDGKVILHQDYWDGVQGFYGHLPVVGGVINHIRSGLGD